MINAKATLDIIITDLNKLHPQPLKSCFFSSFCKVLEAYILKPYCHTLIKHRFRESVNNVVTNNLSKPHKLHIALRFSSLGDIVLCSAFFQKLKHSYPQEKAILITHKKFEDIVHSFKERPTQTWGLDGKSISFFFETLKRIKLEYEQNEFQELIVYDLHGVQKSFFTKTALFFFCLFKKINYLSQKSPKKTLRRWLSVKLRKDLLPFRFIYLEHQKLLASPQNFQPRLETIARNPEIKKILLAPDSQHWKKKWTLQHWEDFILKAGVEFPEDDFTLVGGRFVFPQDLLDNLSEKLGSRLKNRLGNLPLSDLSRIASEHRACICSNSAWQHIAEAADCPVVSLAGPIVPGFGFSPWNPRSQELSVPLKCRPCTKHGDGNCSLVGTRFHACMKEITPDKVLKSLKEILT